VRALARYRVLDTPAEPGFDRITRLCANLFGVRIALVNLVGEHHQWSKSCVGIDVRSVDRDLTFCTHTILSPEPLVIEDALEDRRFRENPFVTGEPFIRFYAGAPLLTPDGFAVGSLCIIHDEPRELPPAQLSMLVDLSHMVVDELELRIGNRDRLLLQKVCEASPALIYLCDPGPGEPVFLGRHLFEELGYAAGPNWPSGLVELLHPEDVPLLERRRRALSPASGEQRVELSYRARAANGAYRWLLSCETVFEHAANGTTRQWLGVLTDITELKSAEARLAQSEELLADRVRILEGLLESAGEGIIVADENGRFTVVNRAARQLLGGGPRLGAPVGHDRTYAVCRPGGEPFPERELPLSRALHGEASDNVELSIRNPQQPERLIRVTGRPLTDAAGNARGGIATFNDITALRAAERELAERAVTDALTGLPNRRAFDERLALLVAEGARGRQFALVLGDVDHFKRVNDTYGHAVGDEVLAHVGRTLRQSIRRTDFVGRYGGEEFCVLLTDVDEATALRLADSLRHGVAERSCSVAVTLSFGVCVNRRHEQLQPATLIETADQALYTAKSQGRNRVVAAQLPAHAPARRSRAPADNG
jgi:diguanylate cyclase (GGDEF)-like protein